MNEDFRKRILDDYKVDLKWKRISDILDSEDAAKLPFYREKSLIFRSDDFTTDDHAYESRQLCISYLMIKDILDIAHNDEHSRFARCFDKISTFWYIRDLSKHLRDYLKHCSQYLIYHWSSNTRYAVGATRKHDRL